MFPNKLRDSHPAAKLKKIRFSIGVQQIFEKYSI